MNGVIETATGDLLRKGFSDFENDGSFDSGTETYKTDVPDDAIVKVINGGDFTRWNGSAYVLIEVTAAEQLATNKEIRFLQIDKRSGELMSVGFVYGAETFSTSGNAQRNFNTLKNQEGEFTWPVEVSTKENYKYDLAQANLAAFWTAGKDFIKGHLDSGRTLKVSVSDATTQAELDAVVDNR